MKYNITIGITADKHLVFGMKRNDVAYDFDELSNEDMETVQHMVDSVSSNLYHKAHMKKYGCCPTCHVKAVTK